LHAQKLTGHWKWNGCFTEDGFEGAESVNPIKKRLAKLGEGGSFDEYLYTRDENELVRDEYYLEQAQRHRQELAAAAAKRHMKANTETFVPRPTVQESDLERAEPPDLDLRNDSDISSVLTDYSDLSELKEMVSAAAVDKQQQEDQEEEEEGNEFAPDEEGRINASNLSPGSKAPKRPPKTPQSGQQEREFGMFDGMGTPFSRT